ncbi:hypothetical protein V6N13_006195 [Hibiscus sabdariffa]|uniref:Transmembrane protein n=1 Tax=Hibiscus sabdariffa TaxID=183260 RepID=A0ABR2ENK1_9ROSI
MSSRFLHEQKTKLLFSYPSQIFMKRDPSVTITAVASAGVSILITIILFLLLLHCESSLAMEASMAKESTKRGCCWMETAPPPIVHPRKPSTSPHLETIVEDDAEDYDDDNSRILAYISQFLHISKHLTNVSLPFVRWTMVPSC